MRNAIIEKLLAKTRRTDLPKFGPGDTIRVQVKIREGEKERLEKPGVSARQPASAAD